MVFDQNPDSHMRWTPVYLTHCRRAQRAS